MRESKAQGFNPSRVGKPVGDSRQPSNPESTTSRAGDEPHIETAGRTRPYGSPTGTLIHQLESLITNIAMQLQHTYSFVIREYFVVSDTLRLDGDILRKLGPSEAIDAEPIISLDVDF